MNMETERLANFRDVVSLGHLQVARWHPRTMKVGVSDFYWGMERG